MTQCNLGCPLVYALIVERIGAPVPKTYAEIREGPVLKLLPWGDRCVPHIEATPERLQRGYSVHLDFEYKGSNPAVLAFERRLREYLDHNRQNLKKRLGNVGILDDIEPIVGDHRQVGILMEDADLIPYGEVSLRTVASRMADYVLVLKQDIGKLIDT